MFKFKVKIESNVVIPQKKLSNILLGIGAEIEKTAKIEASSHVDTGYMRAGIHYALIEPLKLVVTSYAHYDIYWEFGTKPHFVPFFDRSGRLNTLGRWAQRVLGLTEETMAHMGGMQVKAEKIELYTKGINSALDNLQEIVSEAWNQSK